MLEFPELFGSPYVLPAIIVVVVLVLALALLMLRRRQHAATVSAKTQGAEERGTRKRVRPQEPASLSAEAEPAPPSLLTKPKTPSPGIEPVVSARGTRPLTRPIEDNAGPRPAVDPLKQVLERILEGWGDLAPEDLNRLKVFRKEKVVAAIAALEIPKELKTSRYAQSRLNQLRAYATSLREGGTVALTGETTAEERTAEAFWGATPPEPTLTEQALAEEAPGEQAAFEEAREEQRPAEEAFEQPAVQEPREEPGVESAAEEAPVEQTSVAVTPEEAPVEEVPLEEAPVEEVPTEEVAVEELPVESAPALEELAEEETRDEEAALLAEASAEPAEADLERLALLTPEELAQVFESASEARTKMAIIDQLEHLASPAALDIIRRCLDDPDPQVQLHALEAADRLLGTED